MSLDSEAASIIADLVRELATEIDLHHDRGDLSPDWLSHQVMTRAVAALTASGYPAPEAFEHIQQRFEREAR